MTEKLIGLTDAGKEKLINQGDIWTHDDPDFKNFNGRFFDPELLSADDFVYTQHQVAYEVWLKIKGDNRLPSRKKLDPLDMPKALGDLLLLKPEEKDGKQDFFFRLYGTNIARRFGADMTGKYVSDFTTKPPHAFSDQYKDLLAKKTPLYAEHDAPPEISSMVRWCRLVLPFCEECSIDDDTISRILVCNIPIDQPIDY